MSKESIGHMLAAEVCHASSVAEAMFLYRQYAPFLVDYKFVFAAEKGGIPGFAVNRTFSAGAAVRSIFSSEKVLVLDSQTFSDMGKGDGRVTYPLDFSISMDTQAMSYLQPYISNRRVPDDFQEVFSFIARDEVNVDPLPYMNENRFKLDDQKSADGVFSTLKAYETIRTLDKERLERTGEICSTLSDQEVDARALRLISDMYEERHNQVVMNGLRARHSYLYACLMKMAEIQIKSPRRSISNKLTDFLDFCDEELATMFAREAAIARVFFERGQDFKFFKKIQKGRDLLPLLKNMAWDLWHIRQLEDGMTLRPVKEARYFFTALLTFDKDLIEVIDLYPLRAFGYTVNGDQQIPVYDGDWFSMAAVDGADIVRLQERFFSTSAKESRASRREKAKAELPNVVEQLEHSLARWCE